MSGLEDFPRSVRVDVSLGIEGGLPPVDHGPYYVRRGGGTVMESGRAYSLGLSRASASADMERILRASMVRQYAWVLGGDFSAVSAFTAAGTAGAAGLRRPGGRAAGPGPGHRPGAADQPPTLPSCSGP